nr:hypothetical protein [Tanacetum cinerariifolium]
MPPKPDLVFHNDPTTSLLPLSLKIEFLTQKMNLRDYDYYEKKTVQKPVKNNAIRGTHQDYARMTHPHPYRHVVPTTVLTRSRLIPLNAARPVTIAVSQSKVQHQRPTKHGVNKGNPHQALKDKGVIASGCSRHMTRNISYLSDFKEINGGYVAFRGNLKGGKIIGKDTECVVLSFNFKLPDENHVLLRVPNVDLKNIVPSGDLTYLFGKATLEESNLWHRRKNRTLIEAARTMLADLLLPFPFELRKLILPGIQDNFNAGKIGKEHVSTQQYVLLPLWSTGFKDPQNLDADAAFADKKNESEVHVSPRSSDKLKKHDEKAKREAKGKNLVDVSIGVRDLSDEFEEFSVNSTNRVNAANTPITAVGPNSTNNTNNFNDDDPSNTVVSLTFEIGGKSSFLDPSQYPDDLDMPALEDIIYSDDEEDVVAEADFSNLETNITVSPILTTRVYKDHHVTQIIGDLSLAPQTMSMRRMVKEQVDVKSTFLYETIEEEVYVCQPTGFKDPDYLDKVYKVVKALYGLYQAPRAWKFGLKEGKSATTPIDTKKPLLKDPDDIMFVVCACARFQVTPKALHLHVVKRIFRYLKGKPHLGSWYPKDSPFNLVAYSDSDYAGASLDRKSTTGGCQFLSCRLISWQCKKQTVVATSSTKAEYVAVASCYTQVLWIQNQLLDYGQIFNAVSSKLLLFGLTLNAAHLLLLCHKIVDFLNAQVIQYALMVNPIIYVSCIKQFWSFISIKRSNEVARLQALIDRKKVVITEDSIRQAIRLDDADGVDCLPNEEFFTELDVEDAAEDEDDVNEVSAEPTIPLPTPATPPPPPQQEHITPPPSLTQEHIPSPPQAQTFQPSPPQQQPSQTANISMTLLHTLLKTWEIAKLDADEDVTLEKVNVEVTMDANVQGRLSESQAKVYHLDLKHAKKVLTMQDTDEAEPAEVEEASVPRRKRGVIIQDPKEAATALVIMQSENDVVDQVKRKERQDNTVMRYQALKRKPVTEAHARKNMMVYLKNMAGFKMDFLRRMTYTNIRSIFEKHYNLNQAFLERVEEEVTGPKEEKSKRNDDSLEQRAAKKQKINKEIEELKTNL